MPQFEKLTGFDKLYSIRHPESRKNVRVLYTIEDDTIILLTAFLEKMLEIIKEQLKLLKRG